MRDRNTFRISLLPLILALGLIYGYSLAQTSCMEKDGTAASVERTFAKDLKIGTEKEEVLRYLTAHAIRNAEGSSQPMTDDPKDTELYPTVTASIDVDSNTYSNSKVTIIFYFDKGGRLIKRRVMDTFDSP